jgi:hypothetical protein
MKLLHRTLPSLALLAALAAVTAPASAADLSNINVFGLAPVGNVAQHSVDYGIGYRVAKVGPVSFSPLVDVANVNGTDTFHLGAAATVGIFRHVDVGVAEVQTPGFAGFSRMGTSAVLGIHL